ncbi:MAG TPA: hypothetical protein VM431_13965 [Phycisphaerae bacterium]|nr:hypothetical protein [Phycisphaerae bacterium]
MYRLTQPSMRKAELILEDYRKRLYKHFRFDARSLEIELRGCWNVGYQELKDIFRDMLRLDRYRYVAIYYMENISGSAVVSEFQKPLAQAYGVRFFRAPEMQRKRKEFWDKFRR